MEVNLSIIDFPYICRICCSRNELKLFMCFGHLEEVFKNVTNIPVEDSDPLPKNVCSNCILKLEEISKFIDSSNYIDARLKQIVLVQDITKLEKEQTIVKHEQETILENACEVLVKTEEDQSLGFDFPVSDLEDRLEDPEDVDYRVDINKLEFEYHQIKSEIDIDESESQQDSRNKECFLKHTKRKTKKLHKPVRFKNMREEADAGSRDVLPSKSSARYEKEYEEFKSWCTDKKVTSVNEDVLLSYLTELSKKFAPNSLWTKMSMLKTCLQLSDKIDISRYGKVFTFLKAKSECYKPKKANVLMTEQVTRFLLEAPDEDFLLDKVILIFGIFGACSREELVSLCTDNVEDVDRFIIVTIEDAKIKSYRKFAITEDDTAFKGCTIYRKYATLRPPDVQYRRVFLGYKKGKCTRQPVGIHKVGGVPRVIAEFLKLEKPETYTGHCFRRSSATMLTENGGDFLTLKKFRGWKSSAVAEENVEESVNKKIRLSNSQENS